jgi:hypothetical protein
MEAIEKAKLALRKHLLENKEKVAADLTSMRKKSEGKDIFNYIDKLSNAFSFESLSHPSEVSYNYEVQYIDIYELINPIIDIAYLPPPTKASIKTKKDSDFLQGLFFGKFAIC